MATGKYAYEYPRPSVTVDVILLTREEQPRVLLIRRESDPFAGSWALPGGFIEMDETLEAAARRELREETSVEAQNLIQLYTFGDPGRDPRGRTISVAYLGEIDPGSVQPQAADDAAEVGWFSLEAPPSLAFDHRDILAHARQYLRDGHV